MRFFVLTVAFIFMLPLAGAQTRTPDLDAPSLLSEVPSVPGISARLRGLNGGVTLSGVHDSGSGWYELITPAVSYSFGRRYSVDASVPIYLHRLAESATTRTVQQPGPPGGGPAPPAQTVTTYSLVARNFDPGDVVLAGHVNFAPRRFRYTLTPSMTAPSGDSQYGLSTGRVTFDVDNHFEAPVGRAAVLLSAGGGDSSNLVNRLVTRDYTSLGPLAHFQLGLLVPMPRRVSFQSVAYEQLPLGDSKIYTTLTRPGFPNRTVVSGRSVSEDNGFTNSLTVPVARHLTLQGYYNRSLRLRLDTVAMTLTFVARTYSAPQRPSQAPSLIDDLIRK